jgi:hypothetical protein
LKVRKRKMTFKLLKESCEETMKLVVTDNEKVACRNKGECYIVYARVFAIP